MADFGRRSSIADDDDMGPDVAADNQADVSKRYAERGLEESWRRREEHFSKVVSGEKIHNRELRLSRLYGVNTTCPLVQRRAVTEVASPTRAIDLPPPSPVATSQTKLQPTTAPDDRPHNPYIEPPFGSPLLWDKETEYVSGAKLSGGTIVPFRPSHHGLTAFEKLHKDDAKRKFQRGLSKLKALAKLQSLMPSFKHMTSSSRPDSPPRTQQQKKDDVSAMVALLAKKGFAADGSRLPGFTPSQPPPQQQSNTATTLPSPATNKLLSVFGSSAKKMLGPSDGPTDTVKPATGISPSTGGGVGLFAKLKGVSGKGGKIGLGSTLDSVGSMSSLGSINSSVGLVGEEHSLLSSLSPVHGKTGRSVSKKSGKRYEYTPSASLMSSIRSTKMSDLMKSRSDKFNNTASSFASLTVSTSIGGSGSSIVGAGRPTTSPLFPKPGHPVYKSHEYSSGSPHPLTVDVCSRQDINVAFPKCMPRSEKGTFHKAFAVTVTQDGSLGELTVGSNTEQRKLLRERLRWKELRALTSWMTTGPDHMPNMMDLELLEKDLKKASTDSGTPFVVTRDQFWSIVSQRGFPHANANRLFTSFDVDHTGHIDYRFLLASLRALRRPSEDTAAIMMAMFQYFVPPDDGPITRSEVVACLSLACTTDEQRRTMQQLIVEALQSRLGLKSIWAKDVTKASFQNALHFNPILVDCFATHLSSALKL